MDAYTGILSTHSTLRWVVLILAIVVVARGFAASKSKRDWLPLDNQLHMAFVTAFDIQVLLGFLLYFVWSPLTKAFLQNPGDMMGETAVRFFAVEHAVLMVVALAVAHIGRARSKRKSGSDRHRVVLMTTLIALLLTLAAIPWPFASAPRPWLRTEDIKAEDKSAETIAIVEDVSILRRIHV